VLDASLAVVADRGVESLSLREIARRAGVTHAAPYHHFRDRAAVLAALAEEGYTKLAEQLRAAVAAAGDDVGARLEAAGRAYFRFAIAQPAHFRVMFRPELRTEAADTPAELASAQAFAVLVEVLASAQQRGVGAQHDLMSLVLTMWSTAHGLSSLWVEGPLSRGLPGFRPDAEMVSSMVGRTLRGLFTSARGT